MSIMSDLKNSMPNLFRSLRSESSEANSVAGTALSKAAQTWPILKSFQPAKGAVTSPLSDVEKQTRRHVEPAQLRPHQHITITPTQKPDLAHGLSRMLVRKLVSDKPVLSTQPSAMDVPRAAAAPSLLSMPLNSIEANSPSDVPILGLFQQSAAHDAEPAPAKPDTMVEDDSLQAVIKRLEQAYQPEPTAAPKPGARPPAFLSRLGRR
jgi:hypothetical protein